MGNCHPRRTKVTPFQLAGESLAAAAAIEREKQKKVTLKSLTDYVDAEMAYYALCGCRQDGVTSPVRVFTAEASPKKLRGRIALAYMLARYIAAQYQQMGLSLERVVHPGDVSWILVGPSGPHFHCAVADFVNDYEAEALARNEETGKYDS